MSPLPPPDLRWLPTSVAARYAAYDSPEGFTAWARTVGIVPIRRGRRDLWDRLDIDRWMLAAKGHAPIVGRAA